jgi:hypothetical protein
VGEGIEGGDLAEEVEAFGVGELVGVGRGDGFGAAVAAGEAAGLGHLPVDEHGAEGVVVCAGGAVGVGMWLGGWGEGADVGGGHGGSPRLRLGPVGLL